MSDLVADFTAFHWSYNSIGPNRQRGQLRTLRAFERHFDGAWADVQAAHLEKFLLDRLKACAPSTVAWELSCIRPFLEWLWKRKVIDAERILEIREVGPPRGSKGTGKPNPYSRQQIQQLWRDLDAQYERAPAERIHRFEQGIAKYARVRDHGKRLQYEAIIGLGLYGGLRRVEIYNMDLEALHPDNDYLIVRGAKKNRDATVKTRVVPMPGPLRDALGEWLDWRERLAPDHDFPWLNLLNIRYYRNRLRWRAYEDLMRSLGSGWEFHRLRHTFGTEMARAGMPLEKLQEIMGHARIQQTREYVKLATDDIMREARRAEERFVRGLERARA